MDITQLKDKISNNADFIEKILIEIGCCQVREYSKEFRASYMEGYNPTGVVVKKDTLSMSFRSHKKNLTGDLITLVQEKIGCGFTESLKKICKIIGVKYNGYTPINNDNLMFGGYFKLAKQKNGNFYCGDNKLEVFEESILDDFLNLPNDRFLKDNISLQTQKEFKLRYDLESDRIVVPWRNGQGEIIGIMGRYNGDDYDEKGIAKWFPIIPFKKSKTLYGFSENYNRISETGVIFIFESEKSVMQLYDYKIPAVAVGCHSVSREQRMMLKSCYPKEIIIAYDEGIDEQLMIDECKEISKNNLFINTKVGYLYDKNNEFLPKDSLKSPSDLGVEVFQKMVAKCLYYV